jgi:penicillin-binding protein 1C
MHRRYVLGVIIAFGVAFASLFLWPLPPALLHPESRAPVRVLDRNGKLLYEVRRDRGGAQRSISFEDIPKDFIRILLTVEDREFFLHHGVSVRGTLRALIHNLQAGRTVEGGSTITQQLVRILTGKRSQSPVEKLMEMILAAKLEWRLSKQEILERYINTAYFGHQAYGLEAAAQTFFGKTSSELTLGESAFLVGLLQSPSALDPFSYKEAAEARWRRVLGILHEEHIFTDGEYEEVRARIPESVASRIPVEAPHFVFWMLDAYPPGASESEIRTTLDLNLQKEAEEIVNVQLQNLSDKRVTSAAVVVLDARNGDILAMVGSADYFDTENDGAVNVAVSARQPGSALKPFTYALMLEKGDTAATTVSDIEAHFLTQEGNPYVPRNYDFDEHGLVRYRDALANSYNIAAVKVLEKVGVERLLQFLRDAGLTTLTDSPEHYGLALTLGAGEVRLLELAEAYGVFARAGRTLKARPLPNIPIERGSQILHPSIAWLIADILSDNAARVPEFGVSSPLAFERKVAAKTGTTRNSRDNWTVGFTPDVIVGVWVGNADNTPMRGTSGVTGAGPIFHDVMEAAMERSLETWFKKPSDVTTAEVCAISGKLPTAFCPRTITEYFREGTEPNEPDDIYREMLIDRRNGLLASENCPGAFREKKVFAVFPLELRAWAYRSGHRQPPSRVSPLCGDVNSDPADVDLAITSPREGDGYLLDPLIPQEHQKVIFTARAEVPVERIRWIVNGREVGTASPPDFRFEWSPSPGAAQVEAVAGDVRTSVRFTVERARSYESR